MTTVTQDVKRTRVFRFHQERLLNCRKNLHSPYNTPSGIKIAFDRTVYYSNLNRLNLFSHAF